jgi:hypothetical protein
MKTTNMTEIHVSVKLVKKAAASPTTIFFNYEAQTVLFKDAIRTAQ